MTDALFKAPSYLLARVFINYEETYGHLALRHKSTVSGSNACVISPNVTVIFDHDKQCHLKMSGRS